jgi:hypothetical protein
LRLTLGSVLNVQVLDAQSALRQRTVDGRRPELRVGVWGPRGFYYPARAAGSPGADGNLPGGAASYSYHLAVPFDTPLSFSIGSRDLRLGDENGVELSANSRRETFQHASREASPRRFSFRVLGLMR